MAPDAAHTESRRLRVVFAVACGLLMLLPFLLVKMAPITDMPQQVAQIRLLLDHMHSPDSAYELRLFAPNQLSYLVIGIAWWLTSPLVAGTLAMAVFMLLCTGAVHNLAARRSLPVAAAIVATLFLWNHVMVWGLFKFALGWAAFTLWFLWMTRAKLLASKTREGAVIVALMLLLYFAHIMWFGVAVGWFVLHLLAFRPGRKLVYFRGGFAAGGFVSTCLWYLYFRAGISNRGVQPELGWDGTLADRLSVDWFARNSFGGLAGSFESLLFLAVLTWLLVSLIQNWRTIHKVVDRKLLLAAGIMFVFALGLPDVMTGTFAFARRWTPFGMIMLVLAMPPPRFRLAIIRGAAMTALLLICVSTAAAWTHYENEELKGLPEALAALPENPKVLGLDMAGTSDLLRGRPFLHTVAYSQVLHGGQINHSFADYTAALVIYKDGKRRTWTRHLHWQPRNVRPADIVQFEYVLVNAEPAFHATFSNTVIKPVTKSGWWRLYKVYPPAQKSPDRVE